MLRMESVGSHDEMRPFNNLLRVLNDRDYGLIAADLFAADHTAGEVLYSPGDNVDVVHFPCATSMVSFVVGGEDGREVETVLIGREGAVGGIVSQGHLPAYTRVMVKFGGGFVCLRMEDLEAAKEKSPALRAVFARYADCLLAQIFQSSACNAIHPIERRVAKWMVAAAERTGGEVVPFTHEAIAAMLGAGRSHTTRVLQDFKARGLVETRRGSVLIHDLDGLRRMSCPCNELVKSHFEDVLRGVYPRT